MRPWRRRKGRRWRIRGKSNTTSNGRGIEMRMRALVEDVQELLRNIKLE